MNTIPQGVKTFYVIFGVVESLVAALWCFGGAGMYGSPLAIISTQKLMFVLAFLIAGPFSALPAVILALWKPNWGAIWLVGGGLVSGTLAVGFVYTDAIVLPLLLASLPMLIAGIWLIRAPTLAHRQQVKSAAHAPGPQGQQDRRSELVSVLLGVLLFLVAWIGSYATVLALLIGGSQFSIHLTDHQRVVLVLFAGFVGLVSLLRKRLRLRKELVAGIWTTLLLVCLTMVLR